MEKLEKLVTKPSSHQNEWAYWVEGPDGHLLGAIAIGSKQEEMRALLEAAPDLLAACEIALRLLPAQEQFSVIPPIAWNRLLRDTRLEPSEPTLGGLLRAAIARAEVRR